MDSAASHAAKPLTGMFFAMQARHMLTRGPTGYGLACLTAFAAIENTKPLCVLGVRVEAELRQRVSGHSCI